MKYYDIDEKEQNSTFNTSQFINEQTITSTDTIPIKECIKEKKAYAVFYRIVKYSLITFMVCINILIIESVLKLFVFNQSFYQLLVYVSKTNFYVLFLSGIVFPLSLLLGFSTLMKENSNRKKNAAPKIKANYRNLLMFYLGAIILGLILTSIISLLPFLFENWVIIVIVLAFLVFAGDVSLFGIFGFFKFF